ncbi:MAG: hypothetical protein ACR2NR_07470 [Solirubrobacteraceae bacterium]
MSGAEDGFTITVTETQAQAETQDQSVVAVPAGEQLTERQLLEALLIPSGNNIAPMLATLVAGSETRFIAEMNAEAHTLGMDHTTYIDPSGSIRARSRPPPTSCASSRGRCASRSSATSSRWPASRCRSPARSLTTTPLIAEGYAGKTGSDSAAGGCLAFFTHVTVGGHGVSAVGVVMGQAQGSDTSVLLAAAGEAATQLVDSVAPATRVRTRRDPPLLSAPGPAAAQN